MITAPGTTPDPAGWGSSDGAPAGPTLGRRGERATGIEPALKAWKAFVQPQHFARESEAWYRDDGLLPQHLDDQPFGPPTVEFAVEHLLPRAEIELALGHRDDHLMMDE